MGIRGFKISIQFMLLKKLIDFHFLLHNFASAHNVAFLSILINSSLEIVFNICNGIEIYIGYMLHKYKCNQSKLPV